MKAKILAASALAAKPVEYEYDEARVLGEITREKIIRAGIAA